MSVWTVRAAVALLVSAVIGHPAMAVPAPRIAAAANLQFALRQIAADFAREHGASVELVFGASGALTRQIQDGAPFEMFLAADDEFTARLAREGLTRDDGVVYAVGRLAVFAPAQSRLTVDPALDGLRRLLDAGGVTRFAIANPEVAPYGRASEATLKKHGLWNALSPHLVMGDSVAQAAQFAASGNAVGGLVAYSLALAPGLRGRGTFAVIPADDHPPLRQRMVLLRGASPTAEAFFTYLQQDRAQAVLREFGYDVPR